MRKIKTKQLFDEFFEQATEGVKENRRSIERDEIYDYEKNHNVEFLDMSVDEMFELMLTFRDKDKPERPFSYRTFAYLSSIYRSVFEYYISTYELIRNPFNDKRMRGSNATMRLNKDIGTISWEDVQIFIDNIYNSCVPAKAMYLECLTLLYYNGFYSPEEIATLKENMIDFNRLLVRLQGRTIHISDRLANLLADVHRMDTMQTYRVEYQMVSWRGGYFKYPTSSSRVSDFDNRNIESITGAYSTQLNKEILRQKSVLNASILYYLGFYDFLVEKVGKSRADEIIIPCKNREESSNNSDELRSFAYEYGLVFQNVTVLRNHLMRYVDSKE